MRRSHRSAQDQPRNGGSLVAGVSPRVLRSLPSQEVPRKMPADPWVVLTEGIVAETPQGLTVILGRARNGDERAQEVRIDHARRRAALDAVVDYFEGQRLDVV